MEGNLEGMGIIWMKSISGRGYEGMRMGREGNMAHTRTPA